MPKLKYTTLGNGFRERIVLEMRKLIAVDPKVKNRRDFAQRINVLPSNVTQWEKGRGYPTMEHIAKMRKEFGFDINSLIDGGDKHTQSIKGIEKRLLIVEQSIKKAIKKSPKKVLVKYFLKTGTQ